MKQREITSKKVVKAISLGLASALVMMQPMTELGAVVAFADDETSENQQEENTKSAADYAKDAQSDATAAENAYQKTITEDSDASEQSGSSNTQATTNTQAATGNTQTTTNTQAATENTQTTTNTQTTIDNTEAPTEALQNNAQQEAVNDAETAKQDVINATETAKQAADNANGIIDAADDAVRFAEESKAAAQNCATAGLEEAEDIASDMEEIQREIAHKASGDNSELATLTQAFNDDVDSDNDILSNSSSTASQNIIVQEVQVVQAALKVVQGALKEVQDGLEKALTYTSKDEKKLDGAKEVALADVLTDIAGSVEKASAAYNDALEAQNEEVKQYNKLIKEFNSLVEEYGLDKLDDQRKIEKLPYYGKDGVDPDEKFYEGTTKEVEAQNIESLLEVIKDYKSSDIDTAKQKLSEIKTAVSNADTAQKSAVEAAKKAIENASTACGEANEAISRVYDAINQYEESKSISSEGGTFEIKPHDNRKFSGDSQNSVKEAIEAIYLQALTKWYDNVEKLGDGRYSVEIGKGNKKQTVAITISGLNSSDVTKKGGKYSIVVHGYRLTLERCVISSESTEIVDEATKSEIEQMKKAVPAMLEYEKSAQDISTAILMGSQDTFDAEFRQLEKRIADLDNDIIVIKDGATGVDLDAARTTISGTLQSMLTSLVNTKTSIAASNKNVLLAKNNLDEASKLNDFAQLLNKDNKARMFIESQRLNSELQQLGKDKTTVPYQIVREYVKGMASETNENWGTDAFDEMKKVDISGDEVKLYWLIGADGQPTGDVFTEDNLPTGVGNYAFFVGTEISKDSKGDAKSAESFLINGKIYSYSIVNPGDPIILNDGDVNFGNDEVTSDVPMQIAQIVANEMNFDPEDFFIESPSVLGANRSRVQNEDALANLIDLSEDAAPEKTVRNSVEPEVNEVTFPEDVMYRPVIEIPDNRIPLAGEIFGEEIPEEDHFWAIMLTTIFGAIGAAILKSIYKRKSAAQKKKPVERYR